MVTEASLLFLCNFVGLLRVGLGEYIELRPDEHRVSVLVDSPRVQVRVNTGDVAHARHESRHLALRCQSLMELSVWGRERSHTNRMQLAFSHTCTQRGDH
jgi:hypothetical protein